MQTEDTRNIADSLADLLPKPHILTEREPAGVGSVVHIAVPKGFELKTIDNEPLLANPRRTRSMATLTDAASFIDYVNRHASPEKTVAWCSFNPQQYTLAVSAVLDDHARDVAGWREHRAALTPQAAHEWTTWRKNDRQPMDQVSFAEFLQENADDIAPIEGFPSSLDMLKMATEFVAQEESVFKSAVKLQSGGVRMTYVKDADKGPEATMTMFERFRIGIPVFHGGGAFALVARLKYRVNAGKLTFSYELARADRVYQAAGEAIIQQIREGIGGVPLLMGACAPFAAQR